MKKRDDCNTIAQCIERNVGMDIDDFLHPKETYHIHNLNKGIRLLYDAFKENRFIYVMADYDVDGISSGCIFELLFRAAGHRNYEIRFPKRFSEGYGIRESVIDEIPSNALLITVDNGITAIGPVKKAKEKNITVLIVDHHQPKTEEDDTLHLPDADVIINPHVTGNCTFDYYCGAGLAYRLCTPFIQKDHPIAKRMLCMATLATIADVMPLLEENRFLVKRGLELLTKPEARTTGLYALLKLYSMDQFITVTDIGYYIAPSVNAMSRMNDDGARIAFEYLVFDGRLEEAMEHAEYMRATNELRKETVQRSQDILENMIYEKDLLSDIPLCIYAPGLHEGIIGILAGNLATKYQRPAIMFTDSNGLYKGSGRTYGGVNLFSLLKKCDTLFTKWGGHAEAAGVSILPENFEILKSALKRAFQESHFTIQTIDDSYDLEICASDLPGIIHELERYAPYGQGNPPIRFLIKDYRLEYDTSASGYTKLMGKERNHIKFYSKKYHAMGFDLAKKYEESGSPTEMSILCTIDKNHYVSKKDGTLIISDQLECIDFLTSARKKEQTMIAKKLAEFADQLFYGMMTEKG